MINKERGRGGIKRFIVIIVYKKIKVGLEIDTLYNILLIRIKKSI